MNILKREDAQTIANILNNKQTILVMKQAPKNGEDRWWYLYCSNTVNKNLIYFFNNDINLDTTIGEWEEHYEILTNKELKNIILSEDKNNICRRLNGKVVARFWCDKVEEIKPSWQYLYHDKKDLLKSACLTEDEFDDYVGLIFSHFFTIHISKLEIFDRPRELVDFEKPMSNKCLDCEFRGFPFRYCENCMWGWMLSKAPTNYCYIREQ